jgi:phospholipase A1/A2
MSRLWVRLWVALIFLQLIAPVNAAEGWLIATQNELLKPNEVLLLEVVKPSAEASWPDKLSLTMFTQDSSEIVELTLLGGQSNQIRRRYSGVVSSAFNGDVLAKLTNQPSNRLLMTANTIDIASHQALASTLPAPQAESIQQTLNQVETQPSTMLIPSPKEVRTISANEPLYFIVGSNQQRDYDARFQISFKYRPFDPDATVAQIIPYASNLYFAYTQTSIWDLGSESSPFKDTSYRPSIYYHWDESGKGANPNSWNFGLEHESNGRDGLDSRSLNIAFVQPRWDINTEHGRKLTLMPRFYAYLEKSDNDDIYQYRGYVDWIAQYGRDNAALFTAMYRQGTDGYAQGQIDLSYPISDKIFGRTGTFLHLQLLGGYGETLLDYNKRSDTQLRIGISLAR